MVAIVPAIISLTTEYNINRPESEMTCPYLNSRVPGSLRLLTIILITETYSQKETYTPIAEYPSHALQHKVQIIAGSEPLNEDGSPPHHEACNRSSG